MSYAVVGVDPGMTGALALIHGGKLEAICDMPVDAGRVSGSEVRAILLDWAHDTEIYSVVVEDTQPMPRNGSIASFKLGLNTGICLGVVQALNLPLRRARPVDWKRSQGLIGKDKSASRGLACELWPERTSDFRLVKHDGRAEAALIARHGQIVLVREGVA